MSAIILFRSLTHAQRGIRGLQSGGIPATLVRAPAGLSDRGCAYGALVAPRRAAHAVRTLDGLEISHGKVFLPDEDGAYREAKL